MTPTVIASCGHATGLVRKGLCSACYQAQRRQVIQESPLSRADRDLILQLLRDHQQTSPRSLARKFEVPEALIREIEREAA